MKLVVDSNQLQSLTLRTFLAKSPTNFAVLTDYAGMEAHKGDTLASIYKSMAILGDFPGQVIVLKGTSAVCASRGRKAGLQKRLIDEVQTQGFPEYVQHLRLAQTGNAQLQQQLLANGREASRHLLRMLEDARTTGPVFDEIGRLYSKEERAIVREGAAFPRGFVEKSLHNILQIAAQLFGSHPAVNRTPTEAELPNTFIFRVALCTYLLAVEYGARGGAQNAKAEKLRNDMVDMYFAAYATFFDGLLSADAKARRIHSEARLWLRGVFDVDLPSGLLGYDFAGS